MFKSIFIIFFIAVNIFSNEFTLYSEMGKYNKGYIDNNIIKGYKKNTIASNMYTIGGYYIGKFDNNDTIWGLGIAQSKIDYMSIDIHGEFIEQPEVVVTIPYLFIGLNKKYWSFEIGVSYYFNIEKFKERKLINGEVSDKAAWAINRFKSHTFANFKFRLFKEDKLHLELLLARDKFSPLDGLFRVKLVVPFRNFILNTDVSLLMPANNFTESDVILKSNERINFGLVYKISSFNIGANLGILIKNAVGGGESYIRFSNRFSGGLNLSLKF